MTSRIIKEITTIRKMVKMTSEQVLALSKWVKAQKPENDMLNTIQETKELNIIKTSKHTDCKQNKRPFRQNMQVIR